MHWTCYKNISTCTLLGLFHRVQICLMCFAQVMQLWWLSPTVLNLLYILFCKCISNPLWYLRNKDRTRMRFLFLSNENYDTIWCFKLVMHRMVVIILLDQIYDCNNYYNITACSTCQFSYSSMTYTVRHQGLIFKPFKFYWPTPGLIWQFQN